MAFGLNNILTPVTNFLGLGNGAQVDAANAQLGELIDQARSTGASNQQLFNQYLKQAQDTYAGDVTGYNNLVNQLSTELSNELANPDASQFTYGKTVQDFYDPAANQRVAAAMSGLRANAAGAGNTWSSDYQNRMAAKQQALASDEWKASYDRLMADRTQQLNEWNAGQAAKNSRLGQMGTLAGLYAQGRNNLMNAYGDYYGNMASQNNATLSTIADLTQSQANNNMQRQEGMGAILPAASQILGAIF